MDKTLFVRHPSAEGRGKKYTGLSPHTLVVSSLEVTMQTITITLSDDRLAQLQELAARFGVRPEDLVRVSIEELLTRPDDAFQHTVQYVLEKNADLYRRLA
jgi:hypothetical protein